MLNIDMGELQPLHRKHFNYDFVCKHSFLVVQQRTNIASTGCGSYSVPLSVDMQLHHYRAVILDTPNIELCEICYEMFNSQPQVFSIRVMFYNNISFFTAADVTV